MSWNEDDLPEGEEEEDEEPPLRPGDADYDLSEEHGYRWEPRGDPGLPAWAVVLVTALVVAALIVPSIVLILRYN